MGYASVWIEKYLEGERITTGAIVDVLRLDERGKAERVVRTTVPIGQMQDGQRISLDAGKYEFVATLPSGDVLTEIADITAGTTPVPVVFDMGHSEHEWMSWQHALGNVAGATVLSGTKEQLALHSPWLRDVEARSFTRPFSSDDTAAVVAAHLAASIVGTGAKFALPPAAQDLPRNSDPPFSVFRLPGGRNADYGSKKFEHAYALCSDTVGREIFCVLPLPWRTTRDEEGAVEILVGPDASADASVGVARNMSAWSVSTVARDDRVAPVLSYFAAGDQSGAAFLARDALDLLFGKMINPYAASAGAYVLVDRWLREHDAAQWLDWIDNLARWFPWLPDGELLRGWIALAGGKGGLKEARAAFIEAERRGIPVYTAGVKRLTDGLTRIANQDRADKREDPAVMQALDRIRRISWNVDPRYPFTTIRLWGDNR
jgi:hypothetical protein